MATMFSTMFLSLKSLKIENSENPKNRFSIIMVTITFGEKEIGQNAANLAFFMHPVFYGLVYINLTFLAVCLIFGLHNQSFLRKYFTK